MVNCPGHGLFQLGAGNNYDKLRKHVQSIEYKLLNSFTWHVSYIFVRKYIYSQCLILIITLYCASLLNHVYNDQNKMLHSYSLLHDEVKLIPFEFVM